MLSCTSIFFILLRSSLFFFFFVLLFFILLTTSHHIISQHTILSVKSHSFYSIVYTSKLSYHHEHKRATTTTTTTATTTISVATPLPIYLSTPHFFFFPLNNTINLWFDYASYFTFLTVINLCILSLLFFHPSLPIPSQHTSNHFWLAPDITNRGFLPFFFRFKASAVYHIFLIFIEQRNASSKFESTQKSSFRIMDKYKNNSQKGISHIARW